MKNSADLEGCYPPWPSTSVDNNLLDLQNSSYPTQPYSITAKYLRIWGSKRAAIKLSVFLQLSSVSSLNQISALYITCYYIHRIQCPPLLLLKLVVYS